MCVLNMYLIQTNEHKKMWMSPNGCKTSVNKCKWKPNKWAQMNGGTSANVHKHADEWVWTSVNKHKQRPKECDWCNWVVWMNGGKDRERAYAQPMFSISGTQRSAPSGPIILISRNCSELTILWTWKTISAINLHLLLTHHMPFTFYHMIAHMTLSFLSYYLCLSLISLIYILMESSQISITPYNVTLLIVITHSSFILTHAKSSSPYALPIL